MNYNYLLTGGAEDKLEWPVARALHGSDHPPAACALHGGGGGRAPTAAVGALRSPAAVASGQLPAHLAAHALRGGGGRLPGILSTPGFLSEK